MGTDVYIGGWFGYAGDEPAKYIATWDGARWSALGSGINDIVYALAVNEATGEVYVGGAFT
jgi:trimeric autotransporter adhesin